MNYELSPTSEPGLIISLEARFAEAFERGAWQAQRLLEITDSTNAKLGVLCRGDAQMYGTFDLTGPSVRSPVSLEDFNARMKLNEARAIVADFKRIFGGVLRIGMSNVSAAVGGGAVYFVFYDLGAIAIVPSMVEKDRWRLGALRLEGARTMEEERTCASVNRSSKDVYGMLWHVLNEHAMQEVDEDPTLIADALDSPSPLPQARTAAPSSLHDEEDRIDGGDDDEFIDGEVHLGGYGASRPTPVEDEDPTDVGSYPF